MSKNFLSRKETERGGNKGIDRLTISGQPSDRQIITIFSLRLVHVDIGSSGKGCRWFSARVK